MRIRFLKPSILTKVFLPVIFLLVINTSWGQLSVNSCPSIDKRNNGNGQYASAAGIFPTYNQNNPVAVNVVSTPYQTVLFDPATKTGYVNFYWDSQTPVTNIPVITRVWITNTNNVTSLSAIKFGPPPPPVVVGNRYFVNYSFYGQNMPPAGKVTMEFADPVTGNMVFRCTYDLQSGVTAAAPTDLSCAPTISTQPSNVSVCGTDAIAQISVNSSGATVTTWQESSDNFATTPSDITSGVGGYTITTTAGTSTLSISTPTSKDGKQYRVVLTGATGCGSITSNVVTLTAKPKPTAAFASSTICGTGTQSAGITLTGTSPWSITYTKTPTSGSATTTTVNNITTSPYYLAVSGDATYTISAVSDAYCTNTYTTSVPTVTLVPTPTVTITNATSCFGSSSFLLSYTTTGSPTTYSISAGTRALSGFTAVPSGTNLSGSPLTITIPNNAAVGTYDFNMVVTKSGCNSVSTPFTLTISRAPGVTAIASASTVCAGATVTLTAAGADSYSWSSTPSGFTSNSATPTTTVSETTTYTVTGTSSGCSSTASVTVTANTAPSVSMSASTTSFCTPGTKVTLTASGANTYSWSSTPSGTSATGSFIVVEPSQTTTYTVTGTGSNGCTNTASQQITVGAGPTLTTSSNVTICKGSSTTLTVSGATTYQWTPSATLSASTGASVVATPTSTTTYTVYGTTSGCTSSKNITVTVTGDNVTSITTRDNYVYYCAAELGQGNDKISFSIQTSSSQSFNWAYSSSLDGTYIGVTNSTTAIGITTTASSSSLEYTNPGGATNQFFRVTYTPTSSGCTFTYYFSLTNIAITAPVISSSQTICSGSSPNSLSLTGVTSTGSTTGVAYSYQWEASTTGPSGTFSPASGTSTNSTYSPGSLSQTTWYRLKVSSTIAECPGPYYSSPVEITVGSAISNNTISVSDACAAGTQITGATPTGGTGTFTYAWESSTTSSTTGFSTIIGATSQNYTPSVPTQTTWYRRLVTSGSCVNSTSTAVAMYPPITSNEISNGQTICQGGVLNQLAVSGALAGGESGSTATYLWFSSTDNVVFTSTGVTTSSLLPTSTVGTNYYYLRVTKGVCQSNSNKATVVINANPTVAASSSSSSLCSGQSVTLTASGASSYSWTSSPSGFTSSSSAPVVSPSQNTTYTVTGTDLNGCTNTAQVSITYNGTTPSAPSPTTTTTTICSGSTYNLNGSGTYSGTIEWYSVPEVRLASFINDPTQVSTTGTYYVFAKDGSCYSSSYGTVTVNVTDVSAPIPLATSLRYCAPATADLTALQPAAPSGVSYEWHTVSSNPTSGTKVSDATTVSSGNYYLYSYSTAGACFGVASSQVGVTVNPLPVPLVSSSTATAVCSPNTINLTTFNNTANAADYDFSWYTANSATPANLVSTPTTVAVTGTYYLFATNKLTKCQSSASASVAVTINPLPTVKLSSPETFCGSQSRTISATVTGVSSSSYAWEYSTVTGGSWATVSDVSPYSGATTNQLTINPTSTSLSGYNYRCTVTASNCSTISDAAIIVGGEAPSNLTNPATTTTAVGGDAVITVQYSGFADVKWQVSTDNGANYTDLVNNSIYSGVTTTSLVITNATAQMLGYKYRAVVSNTCGTLTSLESTLPVTWVDVSAQKQNSTTLIKWATGTEVNTKDFEIQYSTNATNWSAIGTVLAAGNSTTQRNYSFTHTSPLKNNNYNYYRILQRDLDGKFSYSKIVSILFNEPGPEVVVYPNPVEEVLNIYTATEQIVSLYNAAGSLVWKAKLPAGRNQLPVNKFSKGVYILATAELKTRVIIR